MSNIESNKGEMKLTSFGGNGGLITGSCHVLEIRDNKVVIDFGIFQGRDEVYDENGNLRNLDRISEICRNTSDVLITHPHMDHSGRLPMFIRNGFTPRIWATEETVDFLEIMYADSLKIQKQEKKTRS